MQTMEESASALNVMPVSPASTTSAQLAANHDDRDSIPRVSAGASSLLSDASVVARVIAFS
jgi:hypothetical protein